MIDFIALVLGLVMLVAVVMMISGIIATSHDVRRHDDT